MNLSQLRALVAVAEEKSFSHAAAELGITQSGVSHAVVALERELGAPLVSRNSGGVRLTELGEAVVGHARDALVSVSTIVEEAASANGMSTGRLRLASFPTALPRLITPLAKRFRAKYPNIELAFFEGTDDEVRHWIATGAAHLGTVTGPLDGLEGVKLAEDEMVVVVPEGHPLAATSRAKPADLCGEPFIVSTGGCEPLIQDVFGRARRTPTVAHRVREIETLLTMVAEGLGVSIVPSLALHTRAAVSAIALRPRAVREIFLSWKRDTRLGPAARAMVELIREEPANAARTR